ncbi:LacI family DNA-binding transcriptional regulator [Phycisphaerales bacterium AB-hyl4]|uniref:LacI family DNA-binding transcriptional regulator n=1 Tax=Natronomicrosphaera hydrolytica TaxID=3242702 RepID=A0ABV4U635_9BACT
MTASLALRDTSGTRVSPATRERVRRAAVDLNYVPSLAARSLGRGKTYSLGFICGDICTLSCWLWLW